MASIEECEQALHSLAARLQGAGRDARDRVGFDRTLGCRLTDPDVIFTGRLRAGALTDIRQVDRLGRSDAQIRLTMTGDDLLRLVGGELSMASAWASGRVKVEASVLDLVRLRSIW